MDSGKKRLAVLVGCNYPDTRNELHGCINDVLAMREVLVKRFGFDPANVELLTDEPGTPVMPTGANIKRALDRMVGKAEDGDVLFFHYSGHGTRIPSAKSGHRFRQDEAIVPCDFNLITDMDFRELVNRVPKGASFTIFSDSCHSGGLIDKEKEQIGPSFSILDSTKATLPAAVSSKYIPLESVVQHLASLTNIAVSDIGTHILELFGGDAGLGFRQCRHEQVSLKEDAGILLSGCQANETSADMSPNGGGKAYGAFSNAVQTVLKESSGPLTNKEVVLLARKVLQGQGFDQHPCLYCSDDNALATFLCQPKQESIKSSTVN